MPSDKVASWDSSKRALALKFHRTLAPVLGVVAPGKPSYKFWQEENVISVHKLFVILLEKDFSVTSAADRKKALELVLDFILGAEDFNQEAIRARRRVVMQAIRE
eukprot:tig00020951_g16430.t1